jgi:hypothetical protein
VAKRKRRVRIGEQDENSNWSLRDNVSYYADQAKAAPGAAKELLKTPGTIATGLREMVTDMKSSDVPTLPPDDPARAPIEGVDLETWAAVDAALMQRRIAPNDAATREAAAQEHGVAPGAWERAAAGWRERQRVDARVAAAYGAAFQRALGS